MTFSSCADEKMVRKARTCFVRRRIGGPDTSGAAEASGRAAGGAPRYSRSMSEALDMATIAALVGDPARANILCALLDGRALTASELAFAAHVSPQTASGHLGKLSGARLVEVAQQGRHRYYRLAGRHVAAMLEHQHVEFAEDGGVVTPAGEAFFARLGIDLSAARQSRRVFCRPCLDW